MLQHLHCLALFLEQDKPLNTVMSLTRSVTGQYLAACNLVAFQLSFHVNYSGLSLRISGLGLWSYGLDGPSVTVLITSQGLQYVVGEDVGCIKHWQKP